ncbi:MAG: hypothetical protein WCS37_01915 [Chloroflexota bacterium]
MEKEKELKGQENFSADRRNLWQLCLWVALLLIGLTTTIYLLQQTPTTYAKLAPLVTALHPTTGERVEVHAENFGKVWDDGGIEIPGNAAIWAPLFSYQPITLTFHLTFSPGPFKIKSGNRVIFSAEEPKPDTWYETSFIPERFEDQPEFKLIFETGDPLRISYIAIDMTERWRPIYSPAGISLTKIGVLLTVLTVLGGTLARLLGWKLVGLCTIGLGGYAGICIVQRLVILIEAGPGGVLNSSLYWEWLVSTFGLLGFTLAFVLLVVPIAGGQTLARLTLQRIVPLIRRYPYLTAILTLAGFNALLTLLFFGITALVNHNFDNIFRFWDGPEYLAIAHTLYDPNDPILKIDGYNRSTLFWAAHFPLYPFLIRLFSIAVGYLPSMLLINYFCGTGFAIVTYHFLKDFNYSRQPLWVACVSLFLPLRWLIYRTVGASEAITIFLIVLCLYQFKRRHYLWAGIWGAGVVLARPNGIFLYGGLGLVLAWEAYQSLGEVSLWQWKRVFAAIKKLLKNFNWRALFCLTPMLAALLAVFALYGWRYGDFFTYFHIEEDVKHLQPFPFRAIHISAGRTEGNFYVYLMQFGGLIWLWQKRHFDLFWIGLVLTLPTVFILHDDVLRYGLLSFPLVLLIPFAGILENKAVKWLAPIVIFAVLLYSTSQLGTNLMNIEGWRLAYDYFK